MSLNDKFRVVETYAKYGNKFSVERQVTVNNTLVHKLFGYKPKTKWKNLRFEHYCFIVNRRYGFQSAGYMHNNELELENEIKLIEESRQQSDNNGV